MNMASIGVLLCIFTVICITAGNAFINLQCKTENVGQYGQQSLLECVIQTAQDVADVQILVVTWKKEGDEKPLLVFNRGEITLRRRYSFAEPSWNVRNMNVSLLITNTAVEDDGLYTCMVMTNSGVVDTPTYTSLKVTAKYNVPTIHSIPKTITPNTGGTLMCNSHGGYPKGQLRWFDEHNTEWTKSAEMGAKQTESGLFNLSSKLTLLQGSTFSTYTCIVFNASGGKEDEATLLLATPQHRGYGQGPAYSKIVAPVVVIGSLIVGLLIVLLIYRRRSQRGHQGVRTCESDAEEGDHQQMDKKHQDSLA